VYLSKRHSCVARLPGEPQLQERDGALLAVLSRCDELESLSVARNLLR